MAPVILLSIVPMEMLKNNLILFFNITQNSFTNFNLLPNIEALIAKRLPLHEGAFLFIYDLSFFLTSTAFVDTNAKYGIPLSRYTVFFGNCPLGDAPIGVPVLFCIAGIQAER